MGIFSDIYHNDDVKKPVVFDEISFYDFLNICYLYSGDNKTVIAKVFRTQDEFKNINSYVFDIDRQEMILQKFSNQHLSLKFFDDVSEGKDSNYLLENYGYCHWKIKDLLEIKVVKDSSISANLIKLYLNTDIMNHATNHDWVCFLDKLNKQVNKSSTDDVNTLLHTQSLIIKHSSNKQLKQRIAELEHQIKQAQSNKLKPQSNEEELNSKTHTSVTRIMNVLFHKAQLDITAHKGTTNKRIVELSESLNTKITEKPVSYWIKQVQQLRIDTENKNN